MPISEHLTVDQRLAFVLQGRAALPWGRSVGLKRSAVGRLKDGHFPDPETLIPACRIERMSLSWLLDGIGVPFCVYPAESDGAGAAYLRMLLQDEPSQRITFAHCDVGYCVIVSLPVEVVRAEGEAYRYTAIQVIAGGTLGPETARYLASWGGNVFQVDTDVALWESLCRGEAGNLPLLGPDLSGKAGLLSNAERYYGRMGSTDVVGNRIHESRGLYGGIGHEDNELLWILRGLEPCARETVTKMLRALRR